MKNKIVLLMALMLVAWQAQALTFQAIVLSDEIDNNPGDGVCEIPFGMKFCSLRAAIMEANALGGSHTIMLSGSGAVYELTILGEETGGVAGDLNVIAADITIIGAGPGETIINGNNNNRIFHVSNDAQLNLLDLTLTGGRAATASNFSGGAISVDTAEAEVYIENVVFENNSANAGGAVHATFGTVHIANSLLVDNFTENLGFTNLNGPAIFCNNCEMFIDGSTFMRNDMGGKAIEIHSGALLMMTNSTMTDNEGGGVRSQNGNAIIRFSTFVSDSAQNLSHFSFDGTHSMDVGHSVLFTTPGASVDNCQSGDKPISSGYNIVSDGSCEFMSAGDNENTDAMLNAVGSNGGLGPTFLPMTGSPVIDHVPLSECLSATGLTLSVDQRGEMRPMGTSCDAGAVEVNLDYIFTDGFE